jgi:hypothetical protein
VIFGFVVATGNGSGVGIVVGSSVTVGSGVGVVVGGGGGHFEPPPAPINCLATSTSDSVTIIWFFVREAIRDGFHIYQATTSLEGTAGLEDTRFTVGNLQPNVQYHFDVRAFNTAGESAADACFVDVTTNP